MKAFLLAVFVAVAVSHEARVVLSSGGDGMRAVSGFLQEPAWTYTRNGGSLSVFDLTNIGCYDIVDGTRVPKSGAPSECYPTFSNLVLMLGTVDGNGDVIADSVQNFTAKAKWGTPGFYQAEFFLTSYSASNPPATLSTRHDGVVHEVIEIDSDKVYSFHWVGDVTLNGTVFPFNEEFVCGTRPEVYTKVTGLVTPTEETFTHGFGCPASISEHVYPPRSLPDPVVTANKLTTLSEDQAAATTSTEEELEELKKELDSAKALAAIAIALACACACVTGVATCIMLAPKSAASTAPHAAAASSKKAAAKSISEEEESS